MWYAPAALALMLGARLWPTVLRRDNAPTVPWWQFLLAGLALKGTVPTLLTGQPTFVALALGVGAQWLAAGLRLAWLRRRAALAGWYFWC